MPVCRDQLLLVDYVERVFQEESIYVDEAQLERYMDQQKYFRTVFWSGKPSVSHFITACTKPPGVCGGLF